MAMSLRQREGEAELMRLLRRVDRDVGEAMAAPAPPPLHPNVASYCQAARQIVASLNQPPTRRGTHQTQRAGLAQAIHAARQTIDRITNAVAGQINQYSIRDLDVLVSCFHQVDPAFTRLGLRAPPRLSALRQTALQRINALRAAGAF